MKILFPFTAIIIAAALSFSGTTKNDPQSLSGSKKYSPTNIDSCLFINGTNVNVRSDGNSKAPLLIISPYGDSKTNLQLNAGDFCRMLEIGKQETIGNVTASWIKIQYSCATGWVFGAFTVKAVQDSIQMNNSLPGEFWSGLNDPNICGGDGVGATLKLFLEQGQLNASFREEVEGWTEPLTDIRYSKVSVKGSAVSCDDVTYYFIRAEKPLKDNRQPCGFLQGWDFYLKF